MPVVDEFCLTADKMEKKFESDVDMFQLWLVFTHAAAGAPRHVLESKILKMLPRLKPKEEKPEGIQRHDGLSAEWMAIFKKKEDERVEKSIKAEKKAKQAEKLKLAVEKKSTRKRRGGVSISICQVKLLISCIN